MGLADGTGHVAGVGKRKTHKGFWWAHLKETAYLVDPDTGVRTRTRDCMILFQHRQVEGSFKHGKVLLYRRKD
jgi:hypothetical protein